MSTGAPEITNAEYDGREIKVSWTVSSDTNVTGYRLLAASGNSGIQYRSDVIAGRPSTFGIITLATPLNTNIVYTIQVQTQTSGGAGPASPQIPLLTVLPAVKSIDYDGTQVAFEWTPVPEAADGYLLKIYSLDSGSTHYTRVADPFASRGAIPSSSLPQGGLDPQQQWVASVCAQGENKVSACSVAAHFPKPLPTLHLNSVTYQAGHSLLAQWQPVRGATGYRLAVTSPQDLTTYSVTIPGGVATSGSLSLPRPLYPDQSYDFRLIAQTASSTGVATAAQSIISGLPTIKSARYNGQEVSLTWHVSADVSVSAYTLKVVSLSSGTTTSHTVQGQSTSSGSVSTGRLDTAQTWVASVTASSAGSVGSESMWFPLLIQPPQITSVSYDSRQIVIDWTPVRHAEIGSYWVSLAANGTVTQSLAVENPLASRATLSLANPLPTTGTYTVLVSAVTTNGATAQSAAKQLLTHIPAVDYATYNGAKLVVGWTTVSGANGGYTARVYSLGTGESYSKSAPGESASSMVLDLPGVLGTDSDYLFTLCANTNDGVSSCTPPHPLATALPVLHSLVYNGSTVEGAWEPMTDASATITGYRLEVVSTSFGDYLQQDHQ